ncbi:uncharacterized protein LOC101856042 isoform X2 [Aplysia californica]|uniref:Uncharacterized protein LOC101856042 isoform X2 n=1 Tax=Aplysia californica TaxID=6500 RepID=A0ABM1VYL4_APLCA|nr:uncharacterized protein LOC101856042 isoform X2 [Aplysia californica]
MQARIVVVLTVFLLGLVCLTESRRRQRGHRRLCGTSKEEIDSMLLLVGPVHEAIICESGCCGHVTFRQCCNPHEKGQIYDCDDHHGSHERHDRDDDHKDPHGGKAFKVVTIVLGAVIGLFIVVVVSIIICKKKTLRRRRAGVAGPPELVPEKTKTYLAEPPTYGGKSDPFPPVEPQKPPPYVISGAAPPLYNLGPYQLPVDDTASPTAPPSYSTIDLQEAAGGNVLQVRPAEEK